MKSILLIGAIALCVSCGAVEQPPADEILQMVQTKLPSDPIKLTGSLKVRTRNGFTKSNLPVEMKLNWGADPATAFYQIDNESLTITWNGDKPNYTFSNTENKATSDILGTGLTWADLSFSMLWWPNSKLVGEEKKINREAYVVDVPVPDHVLRYVLKLTHATRPDSEHAIDFVRNYVEYGAGPRASQNFTRAARALALLRGAPTASVEEVRDLARPILRHRVIPNYNATGEGISVEDIIGELLEKVEA